MIIIKIDGFIDSTFPSKYAGKINLGIVFDKNHTYSTTVLGVPDTKDFEKGQKFSCYLKARAFNSAKGPRVCYFYDAPCVE